MSRPHSVPRTFQQRPGSRRRLNLEALERRILFTIDLALFVGPRPFEAVISPDQLWSTTPGIAIVEGKQSYIHPTAYTPVELDDARLLEQLSAAPLEFTPQADSSPLLITLPTPIGGFARFSVVSSPIMAPELAAEFPEIQTFSGQGIDDPAASLRFDVTPAGFHAQVLSPSGAYYIDPFWHLDSSAYISYYKRDLPRPEGMQFTEEEDHEHEENDHDTIPSLPTKGLAEGELSSLSKDSNGSTQARAGTQLRVYALANAATGEYTAFHGGTVSLGQAAIVTAVNRVTGIYENELSVRLVLVANNSLLVYTNAATDPYTNNSPSALLTENQSNIDTIIGNANYDIGHVFSTGGGGLAELGVVGVTGNKARGETGLGSPIGDPFYVDYVAHEMGHQFGGNHTFNGTGGSCGGNRADVAAYEPGSGSTIQAYAGICAGDDLQSSSDPYFHSISFDEIIRYVSTGAGDAAATFVNTGNSVPRVSAGPNYVIPAQTPFVLKAAGVDGNGTDVLSYNWEQRDLGVAAAVNAPDNGTSPIIRSFNPVVTTDRVVPRLTNLLNNTTSIGERLPSVARAMDFRVTVRDNRAGGGGINTDEMQVEVVNTGAAFAVSSPNTAISWAAGSTQTVTWNVAGTTAAPISTSSVNIWLSTDGGLSFPMMLASNVPNDGSETVTMPNLATTQARVKVEPTNSIYFDVSNTNFTISGGTNSPPTVSTIVNRLIDVNTSTGSIAFTVGDVQTAAQNLTVTVTSLDYALLPPSSFVLGGSGANRTLTVTPRPGQFGSATVYVNVADTDGLTTTQAFQLIVEGVLACSSLQSFDGVTAPSLPAGWTSSSSGVAAANWITSSVSSDSPPNNAFVPNPGNISDSLLTSPAFDVNSSNRTIQFRNNYNLEDGFDGGVLEISVDGGPFADVITAGASFLSGGYNKVVASGFSNPLSGRAAWSGNSGGYGTTIVELPGSMIGHSVQLRFRMGSDDSVNATGWRVDNIQSCGFVLPSVLTFLATSASKNEGNSGTTPFDFLVSRISDVSAAMTVQYAVTGTGVNPATASDFGGTLPSGTISFAANETTKTLTINVSGDTQSEASEGFTVTLSNASAGAAIDNDSSNGLIIDDDNAAPTDLTISQNAIVENSPSGSTVGNLATVDANANDVFTYTLVSGAGSQDNNRFSINANALLTATALNFENQSVYSIRVRATDLGGLFVEKAITINVVDLVEFAASPTIGDGTAQRSLVKNVVVTLDGPVDIAPGAFVVDKLGAGGGTVATSTSVANSPGQTVITLSFSGGLTRGAAGALSDGYFRLTIDGTKLTRNGRQLDSNGDGVAGDTFVLGAAEADNFFALYSDTNGDGVVGIVEFSQFRTAFGKLTGDVGFDARFDYEGDGAVGITDFSEFRNRFGKDKTRFP